MESGLIEASRYLVEMASLGVQPRIVDVGGGLGVDYEGTHSRSACSISYSLEDYAGVIVKTLAETCKQAGLPVPEIFTESGRAMTAHHAVLLSNVIDIEMTSASHSNLSQETDSPFVAALIRLRDAQGPGAELRYQEAQSIMAELYASYSRAGVSLELRALVEQHYLALLRSLCDQLDPEKPSQRDLQDEINQRLADKLFCNFSVFQSVPDVWGLDQVFPIMPLQRLDEQPVRRAVIQDLTCDSDGHIEQYVDEAGIEKTLPVHEISPDEDYVLGFFLVGAYQETLGDLHNLFGDTHVINVECNARDYELVDPETGDRVDELLRYIHYDVEHLMSALSSMAERGDPDESDSLVSLLREGLHGYTYHED
jgi:arginine decarboxylase